MNPYILLQILVSSYLLIFKKAPDLSCTLRQKDSTWWLNTNTLPEAFVSRVWGSGFRVEGVGFGVCFGIRKPSLQPGVSAAQGGHFV